MRDKSVNYRRIWEKYNKACILPGMHIHHLDGNPNNNDPENLIVCTPEEHLEYHKRLGDKVSDNFIFKANQWELKTEEQQNIIKSKISKAVKGKNKGRKHSKKSRENMSKAHLGQTSYWKGKKLPKHVTEAARQSRIGHIQSQETINKRKNTFKERKVNQRGSHGKSKKVKCLDTGKIWNCVKDASEELNINYVTMKQFLSKPRKISKYKKLLSLRYIK